MVGPFGLKMKQKLCKSLANKSSQQKCEETNATLKKHIEDVETLKSTQEKELNSLKKVLEQKISATNDDAANLNMKIQTTICVPYRGIREGGGG